MQISANDRIQVALIGAGGMGSADARSAISVPGVSLVAVADLYDGRLQRAKETWGAQLFTTRDYREILNRKDIDAVIIATPDHWHSKITIDAINAGKDVYCEKPMVRTIEEGHGVIAAQRKSGRIVQVGSQYASSLIFQKAHDMLAAGAIGKLNMVEAALDRNTAIGAWQYSVPPDASEQTIDWDRFLGQAPKVPFDPLRFFRWRNYRDYGTGVAGDLFVHLMTGLHFATGAIGPKRVYATGGLRFWNDGRDVPDIMLATMDYPDFNFALRVNFVSSVVGESFAFRFVGTEGVMMAGFNGLTVSRHPREIEPGYAIDTFAKATQEQFLTNYREKFPVSRPVADAMRPSLDERYAPPAGHNPHREHHVNFFTAVRSRKPFFEDAIFGLRAAGPALLTNSSYYDRRICNWNADTMQSS